MVHFLFDPELVHIRLPVLLQLGFRFGREFRKDVILRRVLLGCPIVPGVGDPHDALVKLHCEEGVQILLLDLQLVKPRLVVVHSIAILVHLG
jgi:hypothetical protein